MMMVIICPNKWREKSLTETDVCELWKFKDSDAVTKRNMVDQGMVCKLQVVAK